MTNDKMKKKGENDAHTQPNKLMQTREDHNVSSQIIQPSKKHDDVNGTESNEIRSDHHHENNRNQDSHHHSVLEATFDDILKTQYQKQHREMEELKKHQMDSDQGTQLDETVIGHHVHFAQDNISHIHVNVNANADINATHDPTNNGPANGGVERQTGSPTKQTVTL